MLFQKNIKKSTAPTAPRQRIVLIQTTLPWHLTVVPLIKKALDEFT